MAQPVKQPINIGFQSGVNQKVDPYQVPVGSFLSLVNSVFDKVGRLTKRPGFPYLSLLPDDTTSYLTTFNDDLQAIGDNLLAYSAGQQSWIPKGSTYPLQLSVRSLVRNAVQQVQADSALSPNGLICTVYTESNGTTVSYRYVIADAASGQNVVGPFDLPSAATSYGTPRVFVVGHYFVILYTKHPGGNYTLNYLAQSYTNTAATPLTDQLASAYTPATTVAFDGAVLNGSLYIAYNGDSATGIKYLSMSPLLTLSATFVLDAAHEGEMFSVTADETGLRAWITYYDPGTGDGYTGIVTTSLLISLAPVQTINVSDVLNVASTVDGNTLSLYYELDKDYSYEATPSHLIDGVTVSSVGVVGSPYTVVRSVGLASKAFTVDGTAYFLAAFQSPYQSSYFLVNASISVEEAPTIVAKLAYSNGGGYLETGLPSPILDGITASVAYRIKDLLQAQAPTAAESLNLSAPPVYTQTGINLATFSFDTDGLSTAETAGDLHLSGGFLWMYDGYAPVEHSFFLWPDSVKATWADSGGSIHAHPLGSTNTDAYYYQVTYEWTDNQGNLFRSAPSIPVPVTTTGAGTAGAITLNIPTLRLTYKTSSPVRIVIYRWSLGNPVYYQVTSITTPLQNDLTADSVTYIDTLADSSIIGNNIIYTTGGVVENTNGPASSGITLFDNRLWLLDSEKENNLWYSKTVIPGTPADLSDLFTYYASPTIGAQGPTGKTKTFFPMDDKLILFKDNAIYYLNGTGPTDTGANSQYSEPVFITSTVGCSNQRSIAMIPAGLMFQSNKGIWLLDRNLGTKYIGAPIEDYNSLVVTSAQSIPGTNQVRFAFSDGTTWMYDYFVDQWGQFKGVPSISSTVYNELHTIVNSHGQVSQERPGTYLDGPNPVLMSFLTSWLQLAGLRGYMRAYWFYFLGTYLSPHKLSVSIGYDYNPSPEQGNVIAPINYAAPYGSTEDPYYGGNGYAPYGGPGSLETWQVFLTRQRCKSFQISIQEVFDPTYGTVAGPGLTLSGLNCVVGLKKAYAPSNSNQQIG